MDECPVCGTDLAPMRGAPPPPLNSPFTSSSSSKSPSSSTSSPVVEVAGVSVDAAEWHLNDCLKGVTVGKGVGRVVSGNRYIG